MKFYLTLLFVSGVILSSSPLHANKHSMWNDLLEKNVSSSGVVNYSGFKASETKLDEYLKYLEENPPRESWTREEKMSYWINTYNAYTIKLILNYLPLNSIMEVNNGKAWDIEFIPFKNQKVSLNHIEHKILRAKYKDPRIHFAVNCASFSCPKLSNTAFTSDNLEEKLNALSRSFINNSNKNQLSTNFIKVSQLFNWYKEDFLESASIIPFINKYSDVKVDSNAKIEFMEYNWSLNN